MRLRTAIATLLALAALAGADDGPAWRAAAPGHDWDFDRDYAAHPDYKTEWWYVTGLLTTDDGVPLSYQLTFFRVGLRRDAPPSPSRWAADALVLAHAAVSDPRAGRHVFSEALWRAAPLLGGFGAPGDTTLAWCQAPPGTDDTWSIDRIDGRLRLRARDDRRGLAYDLVCTPMRPPVLHGDDGYSPKTADGSAGSLYFSRTRLATSGTLRRDGRDATVTGTSWLDREIFTDTLSPGQTGWDWLSLRLDDGRDLMLYRLRRSDGAEDFALGTLVEADGATRRLPSSAWTLSPETTWRSDQTGAEYPVAWRLRVPGHGLDLRIEAMMPDQENVSGLSGVHYWEGAVTATSDGDGPRGEGFVELTGYGEGSRPPV